MQQSSFDVIETLRKLGDAFRGLTYDQMIDTVAILFTAVAEEDRRCGAARDPAKDLVEAIGFFGHEMRASSAAAIERRRAALRSVDE
jgi:hypothetical protein